MCMLNIDDDERLDIMVTENRCKISDFVAFGESLEILLDLCKLLLYRFLLMNDFI